MNWMRIPPKLSLFTVMEIIASVGSTPALDPDKIAGEIGVESETILEMNFGNPAQKIKSSKRKDLSRRCPLTP
jgi:hypothetical protein